MFCTRRTCALFATHVCTVRDARVQRQLDTRPRPLYDEEKNETESPVISNSCSKENVTITAEIHARSLANFYFQYADRHMNLKFMRRVRERAIRYFVIVKNKLMSVLNASVLLLTMNFVITLSKLPADPLGYRLVDPQLL